MPYILYPFITKPTVRLKSSFFQQKNLEGENLKLIRKTNELKNATNENQTLKQTVSIDYSRNNRIAVINFMNTAIWEHYLYSLPFIFH